MVEQSDGGVLVEASVRLRQWRREGVARVAHLGTIDAIAVAASLGSIALIASGCAAAGGEVPVSGVTVRAGGRPELAQTGISATARLARPASTASAEVICRIGTLKVSVSFMLPARPVSSPVLSGVVDPDALLGPRADRYFADGYRHRRLMADSLVVSEGTAACTFLADPPEADLGIVECLALTSQLAQVALYSAANVAREGTGNLWMRMCEFTATNRETRGGHAQLTVFRTKRMMVGSADVVSSHVRIDAFPGWTGTAALAFEVLH